MFKLSKKFQTNLKVAVAAGGCIFTLATFFTSTIAWFSTKSSVSATGASVTVKCSGSAELRSVDLIKFNYDSEEIAGIKMYDYLSPQSGTVESYYYNDEQEAFGYDDNGDFVAVDETMNVYDPVERIINGGSLIDLNCNAIYKATFRVSSIDSYMQLYTKLVDKETTGNQILLSTCTDFDLFYSDSLSINASTFSNTSTYEINDLALHDGVLYQCNAAVSSAGDWTGSTNWEEVEMFSQLDTYQANQAVIYRNNVYICLADIDSPDTFNASQWTKYSTYSSSMTYEVDDFAFYNGVLYQCSADIVTPESFNNSKWTATLFEKIYYPTYKTSGLSELEKTYYKISYLSSLIQEHKNFYSHNPKPQSIDVVRDWYINQASSPLDIVFYLNVNYSVEKADEYLKEVYNGVKAVCDFVFDFQFSSSPEVNP